MPVMPANPAPIPDVVSASFASVFAPLMLSEKRAVIASPVFSLGFEGWAVWLT
jgi:hypothetical protein